MNRYLEERTKAQQSLQEWREYLVAGLRGADRKGVRKLRRGELAEVLRLPGDPVPLIHWSERQ